MPEIDRSQACEHMVQQVWSDHIDADGIGSDSEFFAIGGDSLIALMISVRLTELLGTEIPLRTIFDHPVLSDYALAVAGLVSEPIAASDCQPL